MKDATQAVLRQQFSHDEGMQSVLYVAKPEFQPVSGRFVQIINTHLNESNDGGRHWICFSNYMAVAEKYSLTATERAASADPEGGGDRGSRTPP